ncbi:MAG: hypothetical protein GVY07_05710 [Bacteroidetes bacterium]|jgi:hypothetical protein|nr:hypothetical protein [Bacteroidota bacterium]
MKFAIVGERERASAWEKHLRKLTTVKEVTITTSLSNSAGLDALLLIDDTKDNLHRLLNSVKAGNHTYLISKLPTDKALLEKLYHVSEEAHVNVQFSHWPSMSESMNWIHKEIPKPELIQIKKESVPLNNRVLSHEDFLHNWVDELALIIKWMGGNIHRYEVKPIIVDSNYLGLTITLRFENASLASMQFLATAERELHQRIFSNRSLMANCDVTEQKVKLYRGNNGDRLTIQEKKFDPSDTAEWSIMQFIKSIQLEQETVFSPYQALRTANALDQIKSLMEKD